MYNKEKCRQYQQTPEFKERGRIKRQDPEFRARRKEYMDKFCSTPEFKRWQKNYNLKRTYGITIEEFERMMEGQGRSCACCGSTDWGPKGPCVDHDHETGVIRGILCGNCNCAAGYLGDDTGKLGLLIEYLSKFKEGK